MIFQRLTKNNMMILRIALEEVTGDYII